MINQMSQNENTQNKFSFAIKELEIGKLMRKSNITKNCGIPLLACCSLNPHNFCTVAFVMKPCFLYTLQSFLWLLFTYLHPNSSNLGHSIS